MNLKVLLEQFITSNYYKYLFIMKCQSFDDKELKTNN